MQVGGEALERRLLPLARRAGLRQQVERERCRNLLRPGMLAELAPQHAGGEREHRQARKQREVDAQVQLAHQSCALANT